MNLVVCRQIQILQIICINYDVHKTKRYWQQRSKETSKYNSTNSRQDLFYQGKAKVKQKYRKIEKTNKNKNKTKQNKTKQIKWYECYYCFRTWSVLLENKKTGIIVNTKTTSFFIFLFDKTILCNKSINILIYHTSEIYFNCITNI